MYILCLILVWATFGFFAVNPIPDIAPHMVAMDVPTDKTNLDIDQLKSLYANITAGYDVRIRPRKVQSDVVDVNVTFTPFSIISLHTTEQRLDILGYFKILWKDELLSWKPDDYFGTNTIKLPARAVWKPRLVMLKTCQLTYLVADETDEAVVLQMRSDVPMDEFIESSEWILDSATSRKKRERSNGVINVYLSINRIPQLTMFTTVFPLLNLAIVNVFGTLIPIESGKKGKIMVTLFLAFTFVVTSTSYTLPKTSSRMFYAFIYLHIVSLAALSPPFMSFHKPGFTTVIE